MGNTKFEYTFVYGIPPSLILLLLAIVIITGALVQANRVSSGDRDE